MAHETDVNLDEIRATYRRERDRRIRPDGARQYARAAGEFGYYAMDPYTERLVREPVADSVTVLIIGAGFGGLQAGASLREAGIEGVRLMDEAGDVGGTWYWNRYPGVRCDIESYIYMPLLEETGYMPTERYATGEEIRQHAVRIADHYGLYENALFQTRATSLAWQEDDAEWLVETDRGDVFRARYVITSSGTLTQPKLPGIPGVDSFTGHTFHTSRWDYGYTGADLEKLRGKRVGVVGTGATGLQVIPEVAQHAEELVVFQRTPSTVDVRDNRPTDPEWAASREPGWQRELMDNFLEVLSGEPVETSLVTDGWTKTPNLQREIISGSFGEATDTELEDAQTMNRIRARVDEVVDDPETAAKLKPWYRYMCKRPGFSDTYLPAFNRPNVTLVDTADTHGITSLTETAVVVGDDAYELDCLIFATGFEVGVSGVVSGTLPVTGRGGQPLLAAWANGARTLHSFYTHGFPNLLHLSGPQAPNSVNFVHILQENASHVAAVIASAEREGAAWIEPTIEAQEAWNDEVIRTAHDATAFQQECTPGYYNGEGSFSVTGRMYSPGPVAFARLLDEWRETRMHEVLVPNFVEATA